MKSLLLAIAASQSQTAATGAQHPNLDENKAKRIAVDFKSEEALFDKYAALRHTTLSFLPEKSIYKQLQELLYGQSEEQLDFEARMAGRRKKKTTNSAKQGGLHPRLGSRITQDLDSEKFGYTWVGTIYMGKQQPMNVVFDTGSDWLVVESQTCGNCEGDRYNIQPSLNSGAATKISSVNTERLYGSAKLIGKEYTDTVCIDLSSCVFDFNFFLIEYQTGLSEPVDGILGLARPKLMRLNSDLGLQVGPLYVLALSTARKIRENTFSFYFQAGGLESFVDIGEPQMDYVRNLEELVYIELLDDFFWSQMNQGVAIGTTNPEDAFAYNVDNTKYADTVYDHSVYSIIDTGSNAIYFSVLYYEAFIRKLFTYVEGDSWQLKEGILQAKCYDFPPLYFMFQNRWIMVLPSDYVIDISDAQDRSLCILMIFPQETAFHIIGMPLLIDYYTIHEMETGRIGFAPHTASSKPKLQEGAQPTTLLNGEVIMEEVEDMEGGDNPEAALWAGVVSSLILLFLLAVGYYGLWSELEVWFPDSDSEYAVYYRWGLAALYVLLMTLCVFLILCPSIVKVMKGNSEDKGFDQTVEEPPAPIVIKARQDDNTKSI